MKPTWGSTVLQMPPSRLLPEKDRISGERRRVSGYLQVKSSGSTCLRARMRKMLVTQTLEGTLLAVVFWVDRRSRSNALEG